LRITNSTAVVLLAYVTVFGGGSWYILRERARAREAVRLVAIAETKAHTARQVADSARATADHWRAEVDAQNERLTTAGAETWHRIERAKELVNDTTAQSKTLRVELYALAQSTEIFRAEVLTYQRTVDSMLIAQRFERQRWDAERVALQGLIDEQAVAWEGGCGANRFVPCPTRWQSFAVGFAVAIAIVAIF
jgi:hypothetical protein